MLKNGKIFMGLLFGSFIFALFAGGMLPYLILRVLLLILIFSFGSVRINKRNLTCFFYIDKHEVLVGDTLTLGYKLNNTSIIPVAYGEIDCQIASRLGNTDIPGEVRMMKPLELVNIQREIKCIHRGVYPVGRLRVRIRDLFHLFEDTIDFDNQLELKVYPSVVQIERMSIPAAEFFGNVQVSLNTYEDYSSIENIRKYTPGDPIKKIHWKATAKSGELYVKNFHLSANAGILCVIDGYYHSYEIDKDGRVEEKVIEVASSIIKYCLSKNLHTSLITTWRERAVVDGKDIGKFHMFLEMLMDFAPTGNLSLANVLEREKTMFPWGTTLIVFAIHLSKKLCDEILGLRRKRIHVVLILTCPHQKKNGNMDTNYEESLLREKQVAIYKVDTDRDIRDILEAEACIQTKNI